MKKESLCILLTCSLLTISADAIILFGLDNSGNNTNPGTGAPWESVGRLSNSAGTGYGGSGVYLGNGYVLTANHVSPFSKITFDGSTFYDYDGMAPIQVAGNVDMKIIRLTTTPTVAAVNLYTGTLEVNQTATIVGWGVGRNPSVPTSTDSVTWGGSTTSTKRWGLNIPKDTTNIPYGSGNYEALVTVLGGDDDPNKGLGANEAAVTLYDSGSGMFQNIGGTWYLTGLTTAVETGGTSTFGQDSTIPLIRGHYNYFVRVSSYSSQISSLIPEPSTFLLTSLALLFPLRRKR